MTNSPVESSSHLSQAEALIYNWRIHSIRQALEQCGKTSGALTVEDLLSLGHLDQYHYLGEKACDRAIQSLALGPNSHVLDVGSGVGGPARYMSHRSGCSIQGVELREDFNEIAQELTERVGLAQKVSYLTGSILDPEVISSLSSDSFDSVVSFLCLLHIAEREAVLDVCFRSLKPSGYIYIEDYVANELLSSETQSVLQDVVQAPYVPTRAAYRQHFEQVGFTDICFIDLTTQWADWVKQRSQRFIQSKEKAICLFGQEVYEHRSQFYQTVDSLFSSHAIGGTLITARKPAQSSIVQVSVRSPDLRADVYSEQYHFFLEDGTLLALRYFQTETLKHYSAWWSNCQGESRELVNTSEAECTAPPIQINTHDQGGTLVLPEADLRVTFEVAAEVRWDVPGEKNCQAVIHRPQLLATVHLGEQVITATGYCKIYSGYYPKFWGYHFVHAFFPGYGIIWSADATFGQEKYNYFKLLEDNPLRAEGSQGNLALRTGEASYHRRTSAHARIDGQAFQLKFDQDHFGHWSSVLNHRTSRMESDLHLDYRQAILEVDGQLVSEGVCLKESCFGTLA